MIKELMLDNLGVCRFHRAWAETLLPVNPKYETVHGIAAVGSVSDLETGVDLAVIATPILQPCKGIGSSLLEKCLSIAEKRGFQTVHGIVLSENQSMLALGKKLGFQVKKNPDSSEFELVIRFG
jgi:acetyltransferase